MPPPVYIHDDCLSSLSVNKRRSKKKQEEEKRNNRPKSQAMKKLNGNRLDEPEKGGGVKQKQPFPAFSPRFTQPPKSNKRKRIQLLN